MDIDRMLDARANRREAAQARYHERMMAREEMAERQIGHLNSGKFYVYPVGGKYKESRSKVELIAYLIRNNYA